MKLDPKTTALVLIDLQHGIVSRTTEPYPAHEVAANGGFLAAAFRQAPALVVLVNGTYSPDDGYRLKTAVDQQPAISLPLPADWAELVPIPNPQPGDVRITKRQWGGFYGPGHDLHL